MENARVRPARLRPDKDDNKRSSINRSKTVQPSPVRPVVVRMTQQHDEPKRRLLKTLLHVAWLAIALGFVMQFLLVAIRFGAFGDTDPGIAELTNKISWAFLVCTGLAIGGSIADDKGLAIGLSGLIVAPIAFILARGLHKAVADILVTTAPADNAITWVTAGLRGVEYMLLGLAIHRLASKSWAGALAYLGTGLGIGLVAGMIGLLLTPENTESVASFLSWAVNELVFPVGCSLTLYTAKAVSDKIVVDRPAQKLTPLAS